MQDRPQARARACISRAANESRLLISSPRIYGDIFVAALFLVYVALHSSALVLGIHALNSPANCTADVGVGVDLVGKVKVHNIREGVKF